MVVDVLNMQAQARLTEKLDALRQSTAGAAGEIVALRRDVRREA
jgi:hypothetical protein